MFIKLQMNDLKLESPTFHINPFWENPLDSKTLEQNMDMILSNRVVYLFDQNGYDLCELEQLYSKANEREMTKHRYERHMSLQNPWFSQTSKLKGYVLNHSMILERKGYSGKALEQLKELAKMNPLIYKVIHIQPKWGLDFSMDYVDESGECFEVFHHEYDSFRYEDIVQMRKLLEDKILNIDFDHVVKDLKNRKEEWINLEFFSQSEWKCKYFDVPNERFKMVVWQN